MGMGIIWGSRDHREGLPRPTSEVEIKLIIGVVEPETGCMHADRCSLTSYGGGRDLAKIYL